MDPVVKIVQRMNNSKLRYVRMFWHYWLRVIYACDIMPGTKIGNGCKFPHRGLGVVINQDAVIGDNVKIACNVTIGGSTGNPVVPRIGNNVEIGAGALIFGPITIGDGAVIGAGCVCNKNCPAHAVMVGNPCRILKYLNNGTN